MKVVDVFNVFRTLAKSGAFRVAANHARRCNADSQAVALRNRIRTTAWEFNYVTSPVSRVKFRVMKAHVHFKVIFNILRQLSIF